MEEQKFEVLVVMGDKKINKLMGNFDMNDHGLKYFGFIEHVSVTYKKEEKITRARLFKLLSSMLSYDKDNQEIIYARIIGSNTKHSLKDLFLVKEQYEKIKEISDGVKICFVNNLREMGA